jgi:hypothetical protein
MARRILKVPPPFLFRYRPPNEVALGYLEGLLRENHIYASPPRGFLDGYDCRAQIDFARPRAEWLRYWNQMFKKLGRKGKARPRAVKEAMATGAWKDPAKHAEIGNSIQKDLDNSGIICLTDTALDKQMWDEYAGGHRGICLCFESSEAPFSSTLDVTYVPELPMVRFNADIEEQLEAFLLTKQSSYSWEREWRHVDFNKGGGYKPIAPSALRAIVFGSQTEVKVRQEVMRLVSHWKPDVVLWAVDATEGESPGLRLQLLDGPQGATTARIIPPIQERFRNEPVWRSHPVRLLDYLGSVSPEHRRRDLDSRIEGLAAQLNAVESFPGIQSKDAAAFAAIWVAALREATYLVRELVNRSGAAIPGYGEVSVLLYQLVHAHVIKPGLRS